MFSDCTYRLGPRRMIHELFFDLNFSGLFAEAKTTLAQGHHLKSSRTVKVVETGSNCSKLNYIQVANEQRKAELSNKVEENNSTTPSRYELRSPPLSSVQEELASSENLLANETQKKTEIVSTIKTLDSLKLSYKENKFPIRERISKH